MSIDRSSLATQAFLAAALVCWAGCKTMPATKQTAGTAAGKKPGAIAAAATNSPAKSTKGQIDAVLESTEMAAIKVAPKTWSDFTIVEAVPHGARVKKGDILVRCETEKIKEQIADLEQDAPGAKLAFELATAELENLKLATPLKLESAKRSNRVADEDYTYFETTGRAQREKNALFSVKSAEQRLDNATEELTQLEKMYQADDLTEETEEIILKRQRFAVEGAKLSLESSKLFCERELKTLLPREHESLKNQKRDQELALVLAEQTLPKTLSKKTLDYEKMKRDQKKAEKKLNDLTQDLELLTIRSPVDGIVYYGANENGKWPAASSLAKRLVSGGKLTQNEVFMTVVDPEKLVLKALVPEAELSNFKQGQKGKASPVSAPDKKLPVKLEELGFIPSPGGGFEAVLSLERDENLRLMPGMTCKVTLDGSESDKEEKPAAAGAKQSADARQ
jgi:HlyD family secretion protein